MWLQNVYIVNVAAGMEESPIRLLMVGRRPTKAMSYANILKSVFSESDILCLYVAVYRSSTDRVEDLCSSGSRVSTQLQLQQQHSGLSS